MRTHESWFLLCQNKSIILLPIWLPSSESWHFMYDLLNFLNALKPWALKLEIQPDSIRVMGDKSTARETMKNAGVPTVPGSDGLLQVLLFIN